MPTDASQPLHLSVHYNGWGDYPNPNGYTTSRGLHSAFEGPLVKAVATDASIKALMVPYRDCACTIETRIVDYLTTTWKLTEPLYQLEKDGGLVATDCGELLRPRLEAGDPRCAHRRWWP